MADDNKDEMTQYLHMEPMDIQEEELAKSSSSMKDTRFDIIIGHIEDIIMEDDFQNLQNDFMNKHYTEFDDTEENKFIYTDIHKEYCELVESYIQHQLEERVEAFDMEDFSQQLVLRKDDLEGEVFEMLMTFSDFLLFKEMFLDYRAMKEERAVDLSMGITVTPVKVSLTLEPSTSGEPDSTEGAGDTNGSV